MQLPLQVNLGPHILSTPYKSASFFLIRLDNVEARFQETADAFEQVRQMAKKTKSDFEKVKKLR